MNNNSINNNACNKNPEDTLIRELYRLLQSAAIFSSTESIAADKRPAKCDLTGALDAVRQMAEQNRSLQQQVDSLTASLHQNNRELALLHRINDRIKTARKPEIALTDLAEDLRDAIAAESLLLLSCQEDTPGSDIRTLAQAGGRSLQPSTLQLIWDRTTEHIQSSGEFLTDSDMPDRTWPESIRCLVSVPMGRHPARQALLVAINKIPNAAFDASDTKVLRSAASQMAVFLTNFHLYDELQELLLGALRALTSSIDAKDAYTRGHSERVARISYHLADWLGLDERQTNTVHLTGLLHDVGKIGVSEQVLTKPGRLEDDEFDQIKKHPRIGANILKGIKQMATVAQGVLTHHERFDGGGYPDGITGKAIPPAGRIVMLADSFDAMISDRVYRKAMPLLAAVAEIRRFAGTQFDPDVADAFLSRHPADLLDELNAINTQLQPPPLSS